MSSGVKFEFNPTKHNVVLSRLWAVHLRCNNIHKPCIITKHIMQNSGYGRPYRTKFPSPMKNWITFIRRKILCDESFAESWNSCFFLSLFSQERRKQKKKKQIYIIFLKLIFLQNKHSLKFQSPIDIVSILLQASFQLLVQPLHYRHNLILTIHKSLRASSRP